MGAFSERVINYPGCSIENVLETEPTVNYRDFQDYWNNVVLVQ